MPCAGNATESCGGPSRLNIFWSGVTVAPPGNKPTVGAYNYYGCQTEATGQRALSGATTASNTMTAEACAAFCSGYTYFGMEYASECT